MTLPLPADWEEGDSYTALAQNNVEAALNALATGSIVIPQYVSVSNASTLTLTTARNVYVGNRSGTATWTLPAVAANTGHQVMLFNRGTGDITVQRAGSDQVYRAGAAVTSFALQPGKSARLSNDGTYWLVEAATAVFPSRDNSSKSAEQTSVAQGVPFTWSHTVGAAASYAVIVVFGTGQAWHTGTATVTLGGTALSDKGGSALSGAGTVWIRTFAAPISLTAGSVTASVTYSDDPLRAFAGHAVCYTFRNVANCSSATLTAGTSGSGTTTITPSAVPSIVLGFVTVQAGNPSFDLFSLPDRQSVLITPGTTAFRSGDVAIASSEDYKVSCSTLGGSPLLTGGLNLW